MAKVINKTPRSKVVKNKNGSTSTYTRANTSTKWRKTGGSSQNRKKK